MLTASKPQSAAQAASYHSADNYYIKDGITEKGQWNGNGAEALGLQGEIDHKQFVEVLNGYKPGSLTNEQIKALESLNKREGEIREAAKEIEKMPDGPEKETRLAEHQEKIHAYNEERLDFHKDVRTGDLHSQIKELKAMDSKDPKINKAIRELEKEIKGIAADDRESPQLVRDGKDDHGIATHRAGFDFTFSAPKSVSVAALVLGDNRLIEAHAAATAKALEFMETNLAQTRDYDEAGTRERVNTGNLTVAQFTHYTSRATAQDKVPDPQLHTHNFIMNMTKNGDKMMSLEPQQLYAAQKLAGQIYQNELARAAKELGYAVEWDKSGGNYTFEIKGIDKEIRNGYSGRTNQIEMIVAAKEKELGRSLTPEEKNNITLASREYKSEQNIDVLRGEWKESFREMGHTVDSLKQQTQGNMSDKTIAENASAAVKMAVENLHANKAVFSQQEIIHEALKAAQGTASLNEIRLALLENTKEMLIDATDTYAVGTHKDNEANKLYSSRHILKAEANIEKAVAEGKNTGAAMSKEEFAENFEKIEAQKIAEAKANGKDYHSLTDGQRGALEHIATSNDKYIGVQGDAGSGKTTALERMAKMAELLRETVGERVELIGLAPTGKAASNIEADAGIKSSTVDSFLNAPTAPQEGKQQIYLVDESSMLDSVKMEKLVMQAEKSGAKVVFIGDTKQLKPVGAGAMFDRLQKTCQMEFAQVTEVLRQKTDFSKEVVTAFKNVETLKEGLDRVEAEGRLVQAKDGDMNKVRDQFVGSAANDYAKHGMSSTVALVSTNKDRHEFNAAIRGKLVEAGVVSKEGKNIAALEAKKLDKTDAKFAGNYALGDVLVANRMYGDIQSGSRTTVTAVNREDNTVKVSYRNNKAQPREKWLPASNLEHFSAFKEAEKEFAVGDEITFEKNDKKAGVKNGEIGVIKEIDDKGAFVVERDGRETIAIDPKEYPYIAHGYAMTVAKSQGQSIDHVHIYADSKDPGLSTNAGYVQVSRAKEQITVYTDDRQKLEERYKQEQLAQNVGEFVDTKQFADHTDKETVAKSSELDFDNPAGIKAPQPQPVPAGMSAADKREHQLMNDAGKEVKEIDAMISQMRQDADRHGASMSDHLNKANGFVQTSQTRSHNMFFAAREGAIAKDLKGGIRYAQLEKLEAQLMHRGMVDMKATRAFMEQKGFESPQMHKAFEAAQARQKEHLERMVADGALVRDPKNEDKYELAGSRAEFDEYRKSDRALQSKSSVSQGSWNAATSDKLFETLAAKIDAQLIAGGKWNSKEAIASVKEHGLYTKEMEEVFARAQARYARLEKAGVVKKSGGAYQATNKESMRQFVGSERDREWAFEGEGKNADEWRAGDKMDKATSFFRETGRIDHAIGKMTHTNLHTWSRDIKNSYKTAEHWLNVRGPAMDLVAGVVGITLGTAKTVARAAGGITYKGIKKAAKGISKALEGKQREVLNEKEQSKALELATGKKQSFEQRLDAAARGDSQFSQKLESLVEKDRGLEAGDAAKDPVKTFEDRLNEAASRKDEKDNQIGEKENEKEQGRDGGKEKEVEKEERGRD
jgi:conjugative relaxase-like TrwC/TraI family protein